MIWAIAVKVNRWTGFAEVVTRILSDYDSCKRDVLKGIDRDGADFEYFICEV